MDHSSKNHHQHPLGINKFGKSIRKSPLHHTILQKIPSSAAAPPPPAPQPQVYNISKSDFRSIVQQLTGSPAREPAGTTNILAQARPPQPKPPSSRLMKIRPPPLTPITRPPPLPLEHPVPIPNPNFSYNSIAGFHPRPASMQGVPGGASWTDSPVSAYMRYLESSLFSSDSSRRTPAQSLLPVAAPFPSPRGNPPPPFSSMPAFGSPGLTPFNGSQFPLLSPSSQFPLPLPSSQFPQPSPNSQLPLPSPSSFLNLLSPKSPYSLLSPGYFQPFSPNFSFSTTPQSGILGPGPGSLPPPSPSLLFPPSPSGLFSLLSPRWRDM